MWKFNVTIESLLVHIILLGGGDGWKPSTSDQFPGLDKCEGQEDLEDCVKMHTFALEDILNSSSVLTYATDQNDLEDEVK